MSVVILRGDAAHLPLADGSVDLIVTSPPYWQQRDYRDQGESMLGQIGAEGTPAEYLEALWACTREWMRVLKPEGSLFVNLSDKYATRYSSVRPAGRPNLSYDDSTRRRSGQNRTDVGEKSLLNLPHRYAIGCTDKLGLIQRAEIVWSKLSGMPESVTDRVRRSHEIVYHFAVRERYFTGVDEIRQQHAAVSVARSRRAYNAGDRFSAGTPNTLDPAQYVHPLGALPGSVWEFAAEPLKVPEWLGADHYAAYPSALARRIILGWSPSGICLECGQPRRPVPAVVSLDMSRPQARRAAQLAGRAGLTEEHLAALLSVGISDTGRGAATQDGTGKNTPEVYALAAVARTALGGYAREYLLRRPTRLAYACACPDAAAPVRPAVVADPFGGSGTTALTASVLGRIGVSVDRGFDYSRIAAWRTSDPAERARALGVPKPPPVPDGQGSLFDGLEAS